ncbi:MAG: hypothetical protein HPY69_12790 [Armatimonadetes bacterium]|nr:hypothetical protein [Armatimonadota bacterium]
MKLKMPSTLTGLRVPAQALRFLIMLLAVVILVIAIVMMRRPGADSGGPASDTTARSDVTPLPQAQVPDHGSEPTEPGTLALDDFRVVVPDTWERVKEMEDEGPGTKLFLVGPEVAKVRLVVGVDVYPLPEGVGLDEFTKYYAKSWEGKPGLARSEATLCENPAEMISFSENGQEKVFLMMVWRGKGFCVTMISPEGQRSKSLQEFKAVLDTFQVYQ